MENEKNVTPLTSPKLDELQKLYAEAWMKVISFNTPETMFSKDAKDAKLAAYKIDSEIKAEEANLVRQQRELEIAQARSERLKLNQDQLDAFLAYKEASRPNAKTPADKLAELETAFNTAKEAVDNELLAKFAASRPAKVAVASENGTTEKTSVNKDAILEAARSGKSHKEIEDMGYKRSTVWHTINNAKKAGETFPNA